MSHIVFSSAVLVVLVVLGLGQPVASAAGNAGPERRVDGIADNSFFIEEAYNQEPGVVQHIFTGVYSLDKVSGPNEESYDLSFTQEWPLFNMTHQVSYTVPYRFTHSGGNTDYGIGDVLLNYRYQALFDEESLMAFAPRVSLILPTGDHRDGFGEDTFGGQFNLPFSKAIGEAWFVHLNAGLTFLPNAASVSDRDLWQYNLGASAIYAVTRDLHLLLEWVGLWTDGPKTGAGQGDAFSTLLSPGVRRAFNFSNGAQVVAGVAAPVGLTGSTPDYGVFLYLSIEHFFTSRR